MSYIEQNLSAGERVIHRTKIHWVIFILPSIIAALGMLSFTAGRDGIGGGIFFLLISIILGGLRFINYQYSEFGITDKRVLIKVGLIRRQSLETLLTKIESIQVNQGILGRVLNYGTLIIRGTGGTAGKYNNISNPFEFRKKVQEQIDLRHKQ